MSYNLDQDNAEYFEFIIKGNTYRMRYPTLNEMREVAAEKDSAAQDTKIYGFIEAVTEGAPHIADVLGDIPINVVNRFNKLVKDEFMRTD